METITLAYPANDDRFGYVNDQNTLIYPSRDVFGGEILVRSSMQVVWVEGRFICFPSHFHLETVDIVPLLGSNGLIAVTILSKVQSPEDGDRDTEDAVVYGKDGGIVLSKEDVQTLEDILKENESIPSLEETLEGMTKAQLIEYAADHGRHIDGRLSKQSIIDDLMGR